MSDGAGGGPSRRLDGTAPEIAARFWVDAFRTANEEAARRGSRPLHEQDFERIGRAIAVHCRIYLGDQIESRVKVPKVILSASGVGYFGSDLQQALHNAGVLQAAERLALTASTVVEPDSVTVTKGRSVPATTPTIPVTGRYGWSALGE